MNNNENILGDNYTSHDTNFNILNVFMQDTDIDDEIQYQELFDEVDSIIKKSKFARLNENLVNLDSGKINKLNKVEINEVFIYLLTELGGRVNIIDVFSVMSNYFDISTNKFYNSIPNKFKNDLIRELDKRYDIFKRNNINKLF